MLLQFYMHIAHISLFQMDHLQFTSFLLIIKILCYVLFIIFTVSLHQTLSIDPKFEACAPNKSCGDGTPTISYPFWIDSEESYCGYPSFKITCRNHQPVLSISEDGFIVKDIFYSNNSVLVANAAAYEEACPTPLRNISLPFTLSASQLDFFFLYNCSSRPQNYPTFPVDCASNDVNKSFAVFQVEELQRNYSLGLCQYVVRTSVIDGFDIYSWGQPDYTGILKMGFLLDWTAHNCSGCEANGGRCGYDDNSFVCFCIDGPQPQNCNLGIGSANWKLKLIIGIAISAIGAVLMIISALLVWRKYSSSNSLMFWKRKPENLKNIELFLENFGSLHPKRFSYSDIKKITNSFTDKLGEGGFGGVYRGKLRDGRLVAVKVLKTLEGSGEDFINEVSSISRTSHVNVVTLLGFCFEGHKRALVYEFMPNGSLEKFIYQKKPLTSERQLKWDTLYQIAVGIARGLEYLHRGCNTRILHFDIKPHNILLNEEFIPKISDFGLAKICPQKESIVSMLGARGTPGYIAPEVFCRNFGGVSHKSDVYSYGMMVLEMVGGRRNIECGADRTSELYFPHWIYKRLELHQELGLQGIVEEDEKEKARKMIIVSMWCIQTNPSNRPPMSSVVEMLEGRLHSLQIPPQPFLSSPPRSPAADSPSMAISSSSVI